jgi:YD repeat-containing protein
MRQLAVVGVVAVVALALRAGEADPLRHHDPEVPRPDLTAMTINRYEQVNGKTVELGREHRIYDRSGHVTSVVYREHGKVIVRTDYTWSKDRLAKRVYREPGKRIETRVFTYKVDSAGRVVEMTMRDPKATNGERYVTTTTWNADGSRSERTQRHYTNEGPYDDSSASYSASGRLDTHCSAGGTCEMPDYDQHGVAVRVRQQMGAEHAYVTMVAAYDPSGRLVEYDQGASKTTFAYDTNGNVESETRADGAKAVYSYVLR